jgi:hypothetical protein
VNALIPNADGTLCLVGYIARTHRRPWTEVRGGWCVCADCAREFDWDSTLPELNKPRAGDGTIATGEASPMSDGSSIDLAAPELDDDGASADAGPRLEEAAAE